MKVWENCWNYTVLFDFAANLVTVILVVWIKNKLRVSDKGNYSGKAFTITIDP